MSVVATKDRLRDFFERRRDGIVCVYLFGSVGRGEERPDSDIDVAILYRREPAPTLGGAGIRLSGELERHLGTAVDVVVLNRASPDLVHRVLRDGVVVFDADPSARIRFEVKARNAYFDLKPILDHYRRHGGSAHG